MERTGIDFENSSGAQERNASDFKPVAFKEWKVICDTLERGEQSIILRKGGIHEGREGFSFKHREFFLFPTLFHEQLAKTRLPAETMLEEKASTAGQIRIRLFARLEWTATITDLDAALALAPWHVWTEEVVRERFTYDDAPGVHLAFLRVFRCEPAWDFPDAPGYGGCRSWVTIPDPPPGLSCHAVLPDAEHELRSRTLRELAGSVSPIS